MNITNLIEQKAEQWPQQIAIHDAEGKLTYSELVKKVNDTVELLRLHGIKDGMGVGVLGKNSRDFIIMVLAVMKTKAVVMPISKELKAHEINNILETAGLHVLIDDGNSLAIKRQAETPKVEVDQYTWQVVYHRVWEGEHMIPAIPSAALVRFTSGTTGTAKGVVLSHQSIKERIETVNKTMNLGTNDVIIWVLSMAYHFVVSILLYLRFGCAVVICKDFSAKTILANIETHGGTLLYGSPMHIRMLAADRTEQQLPTIKHVISTSTGIARRQCEAFYQRFTIPVQQAYGIIEVGLPIINLDKAQESPDAVGYTLEGYEVEILDDDFTVLPPNTVGHLAMRGPGMFVAYLNPFRTREEALQGGWFFTGDLATKTEDGLVKIAGRKKSMINVAGNKVFPEEVEKVLNSHPSIAVSQVKGITHRLMGEMVTADVVLSNQEEEIDIEKLIGYCRERLSTYKVPQKIKIVSKLDMTDSGKLIRG